MRYLFLGIQDSDTPSKTMWFTRKSLNSLFMSWGMKPVHAEELVASIFSPEFVEWISRSSASPHTPQQHSLICLWSDVQAWSSLRDGVGNTAHIVLDRESRLLSQTATRPWVILFGGTSGCGKSTLASLVAARFGIPTIISTDSVRHILREHLSPEKTPEIFASSYQVGEMLPGEGMSVIEGYERQSRAVLNALKHVILAAVKRRESVVVEGVHLLVPWLFLLMCELETMGVGCVPFLVHMSNEMKHRQRFAVRCKHMILSPSANKYVQHFSNIRTIQGSLQSQAQEYNLPCINNTNVDKSVGYVHYCLVDCQRKMDEGVSLVNRRALRTMMSIPKALMGSKEMVKEIERRRREGKGPLRRWHSTPPARPQPEQELDLSDVAEEASVLGS
eukprot:PhF_6_TR38118/c0_g1_i2/m.56895